jgi:hypothetical protein
MVGTAHPDLKILLRAKIDVDTPMPIARVPIFMRYLLVYAVHVGYYKNA